MLKKLFIVNTEPKPWLKVILWWELRRILYNALLVVFGIISLTALSFIIKDLWSFFSPPLFFLIGVISFVVIANIFYTSGWVFQLLTTKWKNDFINRIKPKLFIYGLIFSFIVVLMPCFAAGAFALITGHRIKSAYADFTTTEPKVVDIAGEYRLTDESRKQFNVPDSLAGKSFLKLNADLTFEVQYFPHYNYDPNGYEVACKCKGQMEN